MREIEGGAGDRGRSREIAGDAFTGGGACVPPMCPRALTLTLTLTLTLNLTVTVTVTVTVTLTLTRTVTVTLTVTLTVTATRTCVRPSCPRAARGAWWRR